MAITRRQFLKYAAASAAALGLSELELFQLTEKVMASLPNANRPKIVALQGQCCNGDIVALANILQSIPAETVAALAPTPGWQHSIRATYGATVEEILGVDAAVGASPTTTIDDVLIDLIDLKFHPTVSGPAGALAFNDAVWDQRSTAGHVVLVEGSVPTPGTVNGFATVGQDACGVGDLSGDKATEDPKTMYETLDQLCNTTNCAAVVAVGTCAAFGGIPAARNGNEKYTSGVNKGLSKYKSTGAKSVSAALAQIGGTAATRPVVNVTGCPIRADDLFLVVASVILDPTLASLVASLRTDGRPSSILGINIHGQTQHFHCSRKSAYAASNFATSFADTDGKCLAVLGCKGQTTYASCQNNKKHQWNAMAADGSSNPIHDTTPTSPWPSATSVPPLGRVTNDGGSSCIKKGHPCIGCKEKGFPDRFSPLVNYNN